MFTNNPLVSIIIPVFNTEEYLEECVNSILIQTYTHIEIILIDDGSPDNSPVICDKLFLKDTRIKIFHKENEGLSIARNYGLSVANGEVVVFLDSDDYWCDEAGLEKLVAIFMDNADNVDFLIFNCYDYYQLEGKIKKRPLFPVSITEGVNKFIKFKNFANSGCFPMPVWTKLIRKAFLIQNNIRFIKGIIGEDIPWFIELVNKCVDFKVVNEFIITYRRQVHGSLTSGFNYRKYDDLVFIVENCISKTQSNQYDTKLVNDIYVFMAYEYAILISQLAYVEKDKREKYRSWLKQYKWLLNYGGNHKVILTRLCVRLTGFRLTSYILRFYIRRFVNRNRFWKRKHGNN